LLVSCAAETAGSAISALTPDSNATNRILDISPPLDPIGVDTEAVHSWCQGARDRSI
jgi:hypothetical protein